MGTYTLFDDFIVRAWIFLIIVIVMLRSSCVVSSFASMVFLPDVANANNLQAAFALLADSRLETAVMLIVIAVVLFSHQ